MKIEFHINGSVTCSLIPENTMEIEILKALSKQTNIYTISAAQRDSLIITSETRGLKTNKFEGKVEIVEMKD